MKHLRISFFKASLLLILLTGCNIKNKEIEVSILDIYKGQLSASKHSDIYYKVGIKNNSSTLLELNVENFPTPSDTLINKDYITGTFFFMNKDKRYPLFIDPLFRRIGKIKIAPNKIEYLSFISEKFEDSIYKKRCYFILEKDNIIPVRTDSITVHSRPAFIYDFTKNKRINNILIKDSTYIINNIQTIY